MSYERKKYRLMEGHTFVDLPMTIGYFLYDMI